MTDLFGRESLEEEKPADSNKYHRETLEYLRGYFEGFEHATNHFKKILVGMAEDGEIEYAERCDGNEGKATGKEE